LLIFGALDFASLFVTGCLFLSVIFSLISAFLTASALHPKYSPISERKASGFVVM